MRHTKALLFALTTCLPNIALAEWSGYYLGGSAGSVTGATFSLDVEVFDEDITTTQDFSDSSSLSIFGGLLMQNGQFVYGGEVEISRVPDLAVPRFIIPGNAGLVAFEPEHAGVIFDLKARAGMSLGQVLPYGVVGFTSYSIDDALAPSSSFDQTGFSIGLGVDVLVTSNVFVGLEYLARSASGSENSPVFTQTLNHDSKIDTLSLRAGFKF